MYVGVPAWKMPRPAKSARGSNKWEMQGVARVAGRARFIDHGDIEAVGVSMQHSSPRSVPARIRQRTRRRVAASRSEPKAAKPRKRMMPDMLRYALILVWALQLAGCGRPAMTAADWINRQAASGPIPTSESFLPVPPMTLDAAQSTGDCNVDKINGQTAQGMAVDHLGDAVFTGWAGDHLTHAVPAAVEVVLTGATGDYWASGNSGRPRPDVANAQKVPAYAMSGFDVDARMYRVPIGDYGISLAYRINARWTKCGTNIRISVE